MSKIRIQNSSEEDVITLDIEAGKVTVSDNFNMDEAAKTFVDCMEVVLYAMKNAGDGPFGNMILGSSSGLNPGDLRLIPGFGAGDVASGGDICINADGDKETSTYTPPESKGGEGYVLNPGPGNTGGEVVLKSWSDSAAPVSTESKEGGADV
jgi:hypothetical protein